MLAIGKRTKRGIDRKVRTKPDIFSRNVWTFAGGGNSGSPHCPRSVSQRHPRQGEKR